MATRREVVQGNLEGLFNPRSIAVIGASSDPRKISGRPIALLKARGFAGPIYPINPARDEIQGLKSYPALADVAGEVDQVLIGLPAASVPEAVEAAIAKKVKSIVIFSAGFSELDAAGAEAQASIAARCAEAGVRLLGPNCLGLVNVISGAYGSFTHSLEFAPPSPGGIAMVSQSGAIGTYALVKGVRRGLKFSRFVATGNEADVDVSTCIDWFAEDPQTRVILAYLESCKDGRRLARALEKARLAGKPVIILKGGSSDEGSHAAASHTGALAGSDAVYDAVFHQTGAARVTSFDEMIDLAYAASQPVLPKGRRLGVATVSGGFGVMMADAAAPLGVILPPLPDAARARIKAVLPFAATTNPVDVTPQLINDFALLPPVLTAMLDGNDFDSAAIFFGTMGLDPHLIEALKSAMLDVQKRFPEALFAICMMSTSEARAVLEDAGLMVFEDPERVINVVSQLARFREAFERPTPVAIDVALASAALPANPTEADAKALLSAAGIAFAPETIAVSAEDAIAAAAGFGGKVALKIVSADIAHKSDIGGVLLNLEGDEAVGAGYDTVLANVRRSVPQAKIDGVLVAPMIVGGTETVIGINNDADFGPVVMFGLGGIFVEVLKDVTFRLAPVTEEGALEMIREIKSFAALDGARGKPPVDLAAIARTIAALSRFAAAYPDAIETIDINPFIALPNGGVAVDALIVPRQNRGRLQ